MQQMWQNVDIVMADCGHLPPKKDECMQYLLDKIKSQQESIWELEEMVSDLEGKAIRVRNEREDEGIDFDGEHQQDLDNND